MADRTVKVTLTAQAAGYVAGMDQAARKTRDTGSEIEKLAQKRQSFDMLGRAALGFGAATLAVTGLAVKAAMDWESAWAGVLKTNDGTEAQIAALQAGLRGLAHELPASHTEIAAVAEAAGQLGVAIDDVTAFTKVMIDLGETTNLSAQDAAMELARFMNVMGTAAEDVDNLGSAVVELGNTYATTEREIVEMAQRLSGAGKIVGLTEAEVLGLSAALSAVGIEAQAGGSAMSKVLVNISAEVETGGSKLSLFAETAGMSAEAFSAAWKSRPAEALAAFVKGLADAEMQGGSTLQILADLGITEVRMRDALLRSSAAADDFAAAMSDGNAAWEENTALLNEAEKRYRTTESQLAILGNRANEAAINFGSVFLPAINAVAQVLGGFADALAAMPPELQTVVGVVTVLAGGIALLAGAALLAVPQIAQFKAAMASLNMTGAGLVTRLGAATAALTLLTVVIAAFGAAGAEARARTDAFKDSLDDSTGAMTDYTRALAIKRLTDIGAFEAAEKAGIGQQELTDALLEGGEAWESVKSRLNEYATANDLLYPKTRQTVLALEGVRSELDGAAKAWDNEKAANADAVEQTEQTNEVLAELEGRAAAASEEIDELAKQILNFGKATLDSREAKRRFQQAIDDARESAAKYGRTLDRNTEAGRKNEEALDEIAESAFRVASAVLVETGSYEKAEQALAQGRREYIATAIAMGKTEAEAKKLADQVQLIPSNFPMAVEATGIETAIAQFEKLRKSLEGNAQALKSLNNWRPSDFSYNPKPNASGGVYSGGVQAFAAGGFVSGVYPHTPGGIHKFAEAGDEAYISYRPEFRERNQAITAYSMGRLGMDQWRSAPAAPVVKVVVQPKGGIDILKYVDVRVESASADRVLDLQGGVA